jgi:hypothetical protein
VQKDSSLSLASCLQQQWGWISGASSCGSCTSRLRTCRGLSKRFKCRYIETYWNWNVRILQLCIQLLFRQVTSALILSRAANKSVKASTFSRRNIQ